MTPARVVPSMLLAVVGAAAGAQAQTIQWAAPISSGWNTHTNWSPANVPDAPGENAVLGLATPYTVSFNLSATIGELHITNAGVVLLLDAGRTLALNGPNATN
ncbi:MAG TPA: hypothetical protein VFF69_16435, partial [Phycisphaerales bacterium]|nr:hypothetical protein [Phycisphaerales bacterium]